MTADVARDADEPSDGAEPSDIVLSLDGISVRFGGIAALNGVSLDAHAGEVLGIIGPNGAGKTTLFDVVSGVRAPNEGRVVLDGNDITSKSAVQRARRGLRRTFQRVQTFGWLTVEDNVLTALEWHGGGGGFLADLVMFPTRRRRERDRRRRGRRGARTVRPRRGPQASSPARCRSASRAWSSSRARSSTSRSCCCSTSRRRVSTRPRRSGSVRRSTRVRDETGLRGAPRRAQRRLRDAAQQPGRRARPRQRSRRRAARRDPAQPGRARRLPRRERPERRRWTSSSASRSRVW